MAQDHFKTPPDPKKGHGIINNPKKKSKKSYRADQVRFSFSNGKRIGAPAGEQLSLQVGKRMQKKTCEGPCEGTRLIGAVVPLLRPKVPSPGWCPPLEKEHLFFVDF